MTKRTLEEEEEEENDEIPIMTKKKIKIAHVLTKRLLSNDDDDVKSALNTLLELTFDYQANFILGEGGNQLLDALVQLFDDALGWTTNHTGSSSSREDDDGNPWLQKESDYIQFVKRRLSCPQKETYWIPNETCTHLFSPDLHKMPILEVIIMILRNLSFVVSNVRYLAHSPNVLRILTAALYFRNFTLNKSQDDDTTTTITNSVAPSTYNNTICSNSNATNNMCLHAIHTFSHLLPYLDLHFLFMDATLLTNTNTTSSKTNAAHFVEVDSIVESEKYGVALQNGWGGYYIAKQLEGSRSTNAKNRIPREVIQPIVSQHMQSTQALLPALTSILHVTTNRAVILSTLELFISIMEDTTTTLSQLIQEYFPINVLYRLTHFIWVPRLGPDSTEYLDPTNNLVSRINALKLINGYDATVDYELRDRSIDLLLKLSNACPNLKQHLGFYKGRKNMQLYHDLIPALTTRTGRSETPQFVANILSNLASIPENKHAIEYIQEKIFHIITSNNNHSIKQDVLHTLYRDIIHLNQNKPTTDE